MAEALPITIKPSAELTDVFSKLSSVTNKLEAQFNFQALTASWFGDENNILFITLIIENAEMFTWQIQQAHSGNVEHFADDVVAYFDKPKSCVDCYVALTNAEYELLQQKTPLLAVYMQTKLQKVLNLIGNNMGFHSL